MKKIKFLSILLIAVTIFIMSGCNDKVDDNIDNVKPTIVINNPTTAEAGIIKIDYVVTDNVTPTDKLKVNIICVKDGMMIEVVGNEFNASETGIYSIQVSATDEANNKGSASLDITVIKNEQTPTGDTVKPVLFVDIPSEAYVGEEVVIDGDFANRSRIWNNDWLNGKGSYTAEGFKVDSPSASTNGYITQKIYLAAGNYKLSYWVKGTDVAVGDQVDVRIATSSPASKSDIVDANVPFTSTPSTKDWTLVEKEFNVAADGYYFLCVHWYEFKQGIMLINGVSVKGI